MPVLSVVTHFYNSDLIRDRLHEWKDLPSWIKSDIEFIVIDDCSEEPVDLDLTGLNARYFRITTDKNWNQGGARNLGVIQSLGSWLLLHDVDQYFYPSFFEKIIQKINYNAYSIDTMYFVRIKEIINVQNGESLSHHPNSFLVSRQSFIDHGMYDEDFAGFYGYEDVYLVRAWLAKGLRRELIEPIFCEQRGGGTKNLNRDLSRNLALCHQKLEALSLGTSRTPILRFGWTSVT